MTQILIIDDDQSLCRVLSGLVNQLGYAAHCEQTLESGLKEVQARPYDVVLLDVQLPDGSGLDIISKIHQTPSSPEVIIITGFGDEHGAEIAVKNGAWDYIQKTDSPKKILLPLQRVIHYRESLNRHPINPVTINMDGIIGHGSRIKACYDLVARASRSDVSVLLTGETGTGKELFARAIHRNSHRSEHNFVIVDCAVLPETLVESILFGHEKGAFTNADHAREGIVAQADQGTLFLDEVGELPLAVQKVFLRVLQEQSFRPVGGKKEKKSRFRLIAATNRDLEAWAREGRFRKDLLYRLKGITIHMPPIREHTEDITQLAIYYMTKICKDLAMGTKGFAPEFIEALTAYHWPGNVRELIKTLEASIVAAGYEQILFPKHLPENLRVHAVKSRVRPHDRSESSQNDHPPSPLEYQSLKQFRKHAADLAEGDYLRELVRTTHGDIEACCRISKLSQSRFYELIKKHDLTIT